MEQMDRGQRSWGTLLLRMKVRRAQVCIHMHLAQWWRNNLPVGGKVNEITMTHELTL